MLCVLYFTCILFVFLINVVTLCECHSEIKGYLLTYLLLPVTYDNNAQPPLPVYRSGRPPAAEILWNDASFCCTLRDTLLEFRGACGHAKFWLSWDTVGARNEILRRAGFCRRILFTQFVRIAHDVYRWRCMFFNSRYKRWLRRHPPPLRHVWRTIIQTLKKWTGQSTAPLGGNQIRRHHLAPSPPHPRLWWQVLSTVRSSKFVNGINPF